MRNRRLIAGLCLCCCLLGVIVPATAREEDPSTRPARRLADSVFRRGEIVNVGAPVIGVPGVGGSILTRKEIWTFERPSLDQAVNLVPGVSSTFDGNRRNEADIFVRGFG